MPIALKHPRLVFGSVGAAFCLAFLVTGGCVDEAEHAHVAWMMAVKGWRPLFDFFQHHTRLWWEVVALYYRMGASGPEVLYFARVLALLCLGLGIFAQVFLLDRVAFVVAFLIQVYFFSSFPELLSGRPEMLSIPFLLWGLFFWARRSRNWQVVWDLGAGAFFGLACYSSPRFALCAPLFLFLGGTPRRVAVWFLGAFCPVLAFFYFIPNELDYFLFALEFSSKLQKQGVFEPLSISALLTLPFNSVLFLVFGVFPYFVFRAGLKEHRRNAVAYLLFSVCLFLTTAWLSWPHTYSQNFIPFVISFALLASKLCCQVTKRQPVFFANAIAVFALLIFLNCFWQVGLSLAVKEDLRSQVRFRREILEAIHPDQPVMLSYLFHPIDRLDSSYYGGWLNDGVNRTCEGSKIVANGMKLPPCDYLKVLEETQPVLVDGLVELAMPPESWA